MARPDVPQNTPKSKRRKEELLVAARETFERLGYFDTRIADIVEAAGVSHGTFYTYFDSKDDVLRVLVDSLANDLYDAARLPADPSASPIAALRASIAKFLEAYRDRAPMLQILEQATSCSEEFLEIRMAIRKQFGTRLERDLRASPSAITETDFDPELTAYALGGMVEDFARGRYLLGLDLDDDRAIDALTRIWSLAVGLR